MDNDLKHQKEKYQNDDNLNRSSDTKTVQKQYLPSSECESSGSITLPTIIIEEKQDNFEEVNINDLDEICQENKSDNNKNTCKDLCRNDVNNTENDENNDEQQIDLDINAFNLPSVPTPSSHSYSDLENIAIPATPPRNEAVMSFRRKRRRLRICVLIQLLIDVASIVVPFVPTMIPPHTYYHIPLVFSPLMAQVYLHKPSKGLFITSLICYIISAAYSVCLCIYGLVLLGLGISLNGGALFDIIPFIASALVVLAIDGAGSILISSIRLHCISSSEEEIALQKYISKSNKKKFICYRARPLEEIVMSQMDKKSPEKLSKILDKMQKKAKKDDAPIIVDNCIAEPVSAFDISQAVPSPNTDQLRELEALVSAAAKASTQAFLNASSLDNSSRMASNTSSKTLDPLKPENIMHRKHKMEAEARRHQPLRKGVLHNDEESEEFLLSHEEQESIEAKKSLFVNIVKTPMQPKAECDEI